MPMGIDAKAALDQVKLIMICNDVSLRGLIPNELAKGFGFFQSKPSSAFSPVAVTPDELGETWKEGKLHLPMLSTYNDKPFGKPECDVDMTFDFGTLVAHAAKMRPLGAGSIIGELAALLSFEWSATHVLSIAASCVVATGISFFAFQLRAMVSAASSASSATERRSEARSRACASTSPCASSSSRTTSGARSAAAWRRGPRSSRVPRRCESAW